MRKSKQARINALVAELHRITTDLAEVKRGADDEVTLIDVEHRLRKVLRDLAALRKQP